MNTLKQFISSFENIIKKDKLENKITASIENNLHKGEFIHSMYNPSRWNYVTEYAIGIILFPLIIPIFFIFYAEWKRKATVYAITNKRVLYDYSFFAKETSSISFDKIQDIHMKQNFIETILNTGNIYFNSSGSGIIEIAFRGVEKPNEIRKTVNELMNQ